MSKFLVKYQGANWNLSFGRVGFHANDTFDVHFICGSIDETKDETTASGGVTGHQTGYDNTLTHRDEVKITGSITPFQDSQIHLNFARSTTNMVNQRIDVQAGVTFSFTFRVGFLQSGTPTYLETLDKLDQWSSAQYIPNSRNKLNL